MTIKTPKPYLLLKIPMVKQKLSLKIRRNLGTRPQKGFASPAPGGGGNRYSSSSQT